MNHKEKPSGVVDKNTDKPEVEKALDEAQTLEEVKKVGAAESLRRGAEAIGKVILAGLGAYADPFVRANEMGGQNDEKRAAEKAAQQDVDATASVDQRMKILDALPPELREAVIRELMRYHPKVMAENAKEAEEFLTGGVIGDAFNVFMKKAGRVTKEAQEEIDNLTY